VIAQVGRRRNHGFTLIEMIVVITIMGLISGLVLVRRPWHSAGLDLDATQRALAATLRLARSQAIVQDRNVAVVTDAAGFTLDGTPRRPLPPGETLTPGLIIFTPEGGASGGTIVLVSAGSRIALTVNWLTGRVTARQLAAD
jgi:general secretion pathway protein H